MSAAAAAPAPAQQQQPPVDPNHTVLHVGNLSFKTTSAALTDLFHSVGVQPVQVNIITHRTGYHAGESKGFGFVVVHKNDVAKAVQSLASAELDERALRIDVSVPRTEEQRQARRERRPRRTNDNANADAATGASAAPSSDAPVDPNAAPTDSRPRRQRKPRKPRTAGAAGDASASAPAAAAAAAHTAGANGAQRAATIARISIINVVPTSTEPEFTAFFTNTTGVTPLGVKFESLRPRRFRKKSGDDAADAVETTPEVDETPRVRVVVRVNASETDAALQIHEKTFFGQVLNARVMIKNRNPRSNANGAGAAAGADAADGSDAAAQQSADGAKPRRRRGGRRGGRRGPRDAGASDGAAVPAGAAQ